ncbi:SDR family NAD(P)-dependent oxidoreductase [Haloarcula salinisoli]|uniref:SDR family oxidoreductase n=1 Tax=Haloarcula salinisoli TaxID=2487746 RepID=A0A8J8CAV0_9EURY|nr:SDR family oxidoreductase [Halomicroarcula salinisoli]MBX0284954.1 SDR family oxidoreductase [Halomicroarcula salinisoli]MBX0303568.1 SDR family oxidoreductase [Halomicroarcula salinisoli]
MDDATVVVTGASRGIGEQVARAVADAGGHAVVCARDADALDAVADDIDEGSGAVTAVRADVRDELDVEHLMQRATTVGGAIDGVVASAGVYHGPAGETPLHEESYAAFDDHLRTNGRGVFAAVREAAPHLAEGARVVVPTGAVARKGMPGYGSYAVSKAAAEALVRGFAADLDATVGAVDPGKVDTDLSGDGGRNPGDVAGMVLWALEDASAETLDGTVLDWGDYRKATR